MLIGSGWGAGASSDWGVGGGRAQSRRRRQRKFSDESGSAPTGGPISPRGAVIAFTSTPRGTLLFENVGGQHALELFAPEGAQSFALEGEDLWGRVVPSEAGSIFIQTGSLDDSSIVELGCN